MDEVKLEASGTVQETVGEGAAQKEGAGLADKVRGILGFSPKKEGKAGAPAAGAKEPEAGSPAPEGEGKKETEPGKAAEEKTYTQADLDRAVEAAKKEIEDRQAEEKRLAALTPQQRAAEEQETVKRKNAELTAQIRRMELEQKAAARLAEKKLPSGLAEFLDYSDEEKMNASLEKIGSMYQSSLEAGVKERLKGSTPKGLGAAANLTDGMISTEIAKRIRGGL